MKTETLDLEAEISDLADRLALTLGKASALLSDKEEWADECSTASSIAFDLQHGDELGGVIRALQMIRMEDG